MTTTITETHWAEDIDVDELHEPTVRAIIDTMKRSGAAFAARVLEAQYRSGQVDHEPNEDAQKLRDLADFIEANPDISFSNIPSKYNRAYVFCNDADHMAQVRRKIGGRWEKVVDANFFNLNGQIGEAHVQLVVSRDTVCERVVVGTEMKLVADPDAPKIEQEVEIVEWICPESLLGDTS